MDLTPLQKILQEIERTTGPATRRGSNYELRCPAHPDHDPSLGLTENLEQHALLYCQAGCATVDILHAVGLDLRDLYPIRPDDRRADPVIATYRYIDEQGELLFEVQRTASKKFRQRRPDPGKPNSWLYNLNDTRRVLYRLPAATQAIREGQTIYLPEGEKDVHSLEQDGHVAATSPGGAGKWRPEYTEALRGAHVVVICDRDASGAGVRHGRNVAFLLQAVAASVTLMQPAVGKDYTDHRTSGLGVDDLEFVPTDIAKPAPDGLGGPARLPDGTADEPVSPAPTAEEEVGAKLRLTPASAFKMRAVKWLWQDRMPLGEICLIPGREGIGKSTFLAWLAAAITRGNLPGIYYGEPRAVLYTASEDAWASTVHPRLHAAGADTDMVYRVDAVEPDGVPGKLILPVHTRLLPAKAEEVKAAILMCDPILSNLSDRINPNHAQELRGALEPLRDAAEKAGIAVAALAHFNKARDVDAGSMVSGSRAWMEVARASILIVREERGGEDEQQQWVQVLTQHKNNLGTLDLPSLEYVIRNHQFPNPDTEEHEQIKIGRVEWLGNSLTTAHEILARRPGQRADDNRAPAIAAVLDYLDDLGRAASPRQIADRLAGTVTYENTKKILARLANAGEVQKVGTGLYKTPDPSTPTENSSFHMHARPLVQPPRPPASMPAARRAIPPTSPSLSPFQTKIYKERGTGTNVVPGRDNRDSDEYRPPSRPLVACKVCFAPLDDFEGTGCHPLCLPGDSDTVA